MILFVFSSYGCILFNQTIQETGERGNKNENKTPNWWLSFSWHRHVQFFFASKHINIVVTILGTSAQRGPWRQRPWQPYQRTRPENRPLLTTRHVKPDPVGLTHPWVVRRCFSSFRPLQFLYISRVEKKNSRQAYLQVCTSYTRTHSWQLT